MQDLQSHSDEALLKLLGKNNEPALREIFNRYWERLYAVAYNRLNTEQGAEDVVQEVLSMLWIRRHELGINHLGKYLTTAVKYAVFYEIRKSQRRSDLHSHIAFTAQDASHLNPEDALLFKGFTAALQREVDRLPEKCRLIFQYSRDQGLSNKEIAEKLQISPKTVEAHISRAIKQLRTALKGPGSFISF